MLSRSSQSLRELTSLVQLLARRMGGSDCVRLMEMEPGCGGNSCSAGFEGNARGWFLGMGKEEKVAVAGEV